jgi:hypothetical protein
MNTRKVNARKVNARKLLAVVLIFVCVMFSACAPAVTVTQAPTLFPPTFESSSTKAVSDFTLGGDPIPEKYLNIDYFTGEGKQLAALRLRALSDPICQELNTQGNCFTILLPNKPTDPGARGPAALINGLIKAKFQLVPYGPDDVGSIESFQPKEDGEVLTGVKCETKTGAACNADVGSIWKSATQQKTFPVQNMQQLYPFTFTYGAEWDVQGGIQTVGIIYKGNPPEPESQWWGPGIILVNGALVHDPVDVGSDQPAKANKANFIPWPDDFFAYITSLPGVKVIQGPDLVTIGGIQGNQIIVHTPAMHPILWLKDDYTWLGGGASGVDPDLKRQLILLDVNGEHILLEFDDSPEKFDEHYPLVQEVFNSITFMK